MIERGALQESKIRLLRINGLLKEKPSEVEI